ncbi:MAG: LysE family translocator [Enhydrobacter sp.]|nr:MAG: LysE family translocator [Enhydrobacter sp.]
MILTNWWYAAVTILVVMATPGPAMLLGLAVATQHGILRSLYVGAGILIAFSFFALLSLSGIGALVLAEPMVLTMLQWFGVLYLAWLGTKALLRFRAMTSNQSLSDAVSAAEKSSSFFRHGFLMSMSNMNAVLFFTAIFPQFIDAGVPIAPQVTLLYITFCFCWLVAFLLYATLGAFIREHVRSSATRWLHLVSGTVYFAAAGMLGFRR